MNNTMRVLKHFVIVLCVVAASVSLAAQTPPQTEQQKKFIPLSEAPPQEQIPSARLVIGAYSFVMVTFFAYLLSLSKRLSSVKEELTRLESDAKRSRRA
jgi:hypothetical protein